MLVASPGRFEPINLSEVTRVAHSMCIRTRGRAGRVGAAAPLAGRHQHETEYERADVATGTAILATTLRPGRRSWRVRNALIQRSGGCFVRRHPRGCSSAISIGILAAVR